MNKFINKWGLQEDVQMDISNWGHEIWLQLYEPGTWGVKDRSENRFIWSFLLNNSGISNELEQYTFEQFDGYPYTDEFKTDDTCCFYKRFGSDNKEPIIFRRSFPTKKEYIEISQEFVHFFQLFHDIQNNQYLLEHDDGKEEIVLKISDNSKVYVKTQRLKQFLAFKDMVLVKCILNRRFFNDPIECEFEAGNSMPIIQQKNDELHYVLWYQTGIANTTFTTEILGKKIIYGMPIENTGIYPFESKRQYESFLIGLDKNGNEIINSCNPDELANYFGANPNAPHYLTPVFFSKDVLSKYYSDTTKFHIGDGIINIGSCSLRADTNHPKFVIVFLGDLGRDITHNEQIYWRSFNILPEGRISNTAYRRSFLGEFADPEAEQFIFLKKYNDLIKMYCELNGDDFIKPLSQDDEYRLNELRIPVKDNQQEFDLLVEHLQIILIESINDSYLRKLLSRAGLVNEIKGKRSIKKLDLLFSHLGFVDYGQHIEFLEKLYWLRTKGSSHRKGSDEYKEVRDYFQLDSKGYIATFRELIIQAIEFLDFIISIAGNEQLRINGVST